MVLLNSVNGQMGAVGYTVAVEYAFYLFFALGLLHIISVLVTKRLRENSQHGTADRIDLWTRIIFFLAVLGMFLGGFYQYKTS